MVIVLFSFVVESDADFGLLFFDGLRLGLDFCLLLIGLSLPVSHSKIELWLLLLCLYCYRFLFRDFQRVFRLGKSDWLFVECDAFGFELLHYLWFLLFLNN